MFFVVNFPVKFLKFVSQGLLPSTFWGTGHSNKSESEYISSLNRSITQELSLPLPLIRNLILAQIVQSRVASYVDDYFETQGDAAAFNTAQAESQSMLYGIAAEEELLPHFVDHAPTHASTTTAFATSTYRLPLATNTYYLLLTAY